MTNAEFKKLFNTLYNNINNNAAPGLSDAEISIFLNKALDEIVKSHVLGPTTTYLMGINQISKRDVELDSLIISTNYTSYTSSDVAKMHPYGELCTPNYTVLVNNQSVTYDPLVILSEVVTVSQVNLDVVELSYVLFNRFMAGVYKFPKKNQCWKLRHDNKFEFIAPANVTIAPADIVLVYVKTPRLIKITSDNTNVGCELPDVLHPEILQRAVELAKAAYASETLSMQMSMGKRSE